MELNELIKNVQQWSIDRGLDKADSKKQLLKLYEEFGELASGIAKNQPDVIMDSIGDCVVVLIILAQQLKIKGISSEEVIYIDHNDVMLGLSCEIGNISYRLLNGLRTASMEIPIAKTLTSLKIVAEKNDFKFEDCLEMAWNAIKDRKGKLVDGVWVKEEDLEVKADEVLTEKIIANRDFTELGLKCASLSKHATSPEQTLDAVIEADMINNPSHYQGRNGLEALDVVREFAACPEYVEGFHWGNAMKYMMRYHKKNGVEDLKKARKNLDWLIEELEHGNARERVRSL